jgi:hypothetical protein
MWWMRQMAPRRTRPADLRRQIRALLIRNARARVQLQRGRAVQGYDLLDQLLAELEKSAAGGPAERWVGAASAGGRESAPAWRGGRGAFAERMLDLRRQRATHALDVLARRWGIGSPATQPGERLASSRNVVMADYDH